MWHVMFAVIALLISLVALLATFLGCVNANDFDTIMDEQKEK